MASPGGQGTQVSALVSPANGQGTWTDSSGNSGTFAFFAASPGLPVRPAGTAPVDIAPNPNQANDICEGVQAPPTLIYCGSTAARWQSGGFGIDGIQVWRDNNGYVHIRGSALLTAGTAAGTVFVLPPELRPRRIMGIPVATSLSSSSEAGAALLLIYPRNYPNANIAGRVRVNSNDTPGYNVVHLGEITFRVDQ